MRNVGYSLNRSASVMFSRDVAHHLERSLLNDAAEIIGRDPHLTVVRSRRWTSRDRTGEMDLAVLDQRARSVLLHIQAKAAIAPEGNRMTQAVERRIAEGFAQIDAFRQLAQSDRDDVASRIFGKRLAGVRIVDAVLGRAGFGTSEVWRRLSTDVVPLNLNILQGLVTAGAEGIPTFDLGQLPESVDRLLGGVEAAAKPAWAKTETDLGWLMLDMPQLDWDDEALLPLRSRYFPRVGKWRGS
jgi:hypothetical protein